MYNNTLDASSQLFTRAEVSRRCLADEDVNTVSSVKAVQKANDRFKGRGCYGNRLTELMT